MTGVWVPSVAVQFAVHLVLLCQGFVHRIHSATKGGGIQRTYVRRDDRDLIIQLAILVHCDASLAVRNGMSVELEQKSAG